jgi:hypothetical protein
MKASCLRRRYSQRTAAHVTCQYSGPFPLARWQRRGCSGVCLVAAPKPRPTPLVLHPGARDGDDRRAASMASRSRGRNRRRGWCVPLAMVARIVRAARPPKPPPPRPPRPPPPPPCHGGTRMPPNFVLLRHVARRREAGGRHGASPRRCREPLLVAPAGVDAGGGLRFLLIANHTVPASRHAEPR